MSVVPIVQFPKASFQLTTMNSSHAGILIPPEYVRKTSREIPIDIILADINMSLQAFCQFLG